MMDETIPVTAAAGPRMGPVARMARRMIHEHLARLTGGSVTIRDTLGVATLGKSAAPDGLHVRVTVHDPRFYPQLLRGGSLGAAEAYMDGSWSASDLTSLFRIFLREQTSGRAFDRGLARIAGYLARGAEALRRNTRRGSRRNIAAHYDLGNDFFQLFLDETMTYSCGIFAQADASLRDASLTKLDRVCRKLNLRASDHVLEIGTGWGSFAIHAAREYGCRVTTTTISPRQHALARDRIAAAGVADRVRVLGEDYRDLTGTYDKLVSIEMIEAVGHEFLPAYFGACSRLLAPDGVMVLQAITLPDHRYEQARRSADFIQRYIFPGSRVPSLAAMCDAVARATDLRLVHLEEIGPHYALTLRRWRERFTAQLDEVRRLGYPDHFIRMWLYYLSYCEAGFAEGYLGDVQMVLRKPGARCTVLPRLPEPVPYFSEDRSAP